MKPILTLGMIKNLHKGNAVFNLSKIREDLLKNYLFNSININMQTQVFYNKNTDEYIFIFKVPSDSNYKYTKPFFYDVIFCFSPINKQSKLSDTLNDYKITVFSNCPSFIFSYCFVFKKYGYLINFIDNKYWNKTALKQNPSVRNTFEIILYEKSIYYSYLYIILNNLIHKKQIENYSNLKIITNNKQAISYVHITSQDDLLVQLKIWRKYHTEKKSERIKLKTIKQKKEFEKRETQSIFGYLRNNA